MTELWPGLYDISEELIVDGGEELPLAPRTEQQRVQINVRRVQLPWLGTHVLYVEEYPFDTRRRLLLSIAPEPMTDGSLRVRQFTRRPEAMSAATLMADDVESIES